MASALIGALRVTLGLNSAAFEKGADRSIRKMDAVSKAGFATGRAFRGLAGIAATAGIALAGVFSSRAVKDALDYAASIGEVATALGVTQRELQVFRFAATQVNLTQEQMDKSLQKLTLTIGKAAGGARQEAHSFQTLGIAIKDAEGNIRPTGQIIEDVADRLASIRDPAERAAAAYALFGRQGQKLLPLLENGAAGLKEFGRQAEEAGVIIADGDIAAADKTADKIEALTTQLKVNFSRVVAQNADAILSLTNALAALISMMARGLSLISQYPTLLGAVAGGLVGLRFGGLPGGVAGAGLGALGGNLLGGKLSDANTDLTVRRKELEKALAAQNRLLAAQNEPARIFKISSGETSGTLKGATAEVRRQTQLLRNATAQVRQDTAATVAAAGPDLSSLFDLTGGGAGGGGKASKAARDFVSEIRDDLTSLSADIEDAFSTVRLPDSIEAANELRLKLAEIADDARKAGVPMSQFSGEVATLQARISELETEGLAREADEFSQAVARLADELRDMDGSLTPLDGRLASIDDRFERTRESILEQIEENRVLAAANRDAANAMAELEAMLLRLDSAHRKAAEAARVQYEAEQRIADVAALAEGNRIGEDIGRLSQARGDQGFFTSDQLEMQRLERELTAERIDALGRLTALNADLESARQANDAQQVARLTGIIALQEEYYNLIVDTSAQQILTTQRLQSAFEDFTSGLSDALYDMVTRFDFSLQKLADVFLQLLNDIFLRPALDSIAGSVGGLLQGLFAGGFATGGVIPRGQWGIVGEAGPEPVFAGDAPLNVLPNDTLGGGAVFNITVQGAMSDRDARRTGNQIGAAAANSYTRAQKAGLAGSVS